MTETLRQTTSATVSALRIILPLQGQSGSQDKQPAPAFISWPNGDKGTRVQDVEVGLDADTLFKVLWGPDAPVAAACRQKLGSRGYLETSWLPSEADAEAALTNAAVGHAANEPERLDGGLDTLSSTSRVTLQARPKLVGAGYKGHCRMNSCHGTHLGRSVCSFERELCLDANDGGPYALEICVRSTATMADRFRCVFIHRVIAVSSRQSRWTVDFTLQFVEKTTFLLRKTIESGAHAGVKRNFHLMAEILRDYARTHAHVADVL